MKMALIYYGWMLARLAASAEEAAPESAVDAPAQDQQVPSIRITLEDPASIQRGILAAHRAGLKRVTIPAGTYRLTVCERRAYLSFADLADLEIDARNVTLLRTDPTKGGIEFSRCRNVTLRGMTLLNETPPFTQGVLLAIDPGGDWYDVRIDKGYPANFDEPRTGVSQPRATIFDARTRRLKPGTTDCFFGRVVRRGPDLFRLYFKSGHKLNPKTHPAAVGDWIAFRGRGTTDISLTDCADMVIDGVTILSGGGFCVHETGGEGGNRYTYRVTYGPKPDGADKAPLIASNADAFHSGGVRKGPTLENCLFEGMQDDGIPIRGSFVRVVEASGHQVKLAGGGFFQVGDPIRFIDPSGSFLGEAVVKAIGVATAVSFPTNSSQGSGRSRISVTLKLDRAVVIKPQDLASDPAANGSGYVIRNCVIRNHRARGMLLKADNGLVEGNTVEGSSIAGIVIAPEVSWMESGYSHNVIVRNNTIRYCGYSTVGSSDHQAGALTLGGGAGQADKLVPIYQESVMATLNPGHRHILIENNTFENCDSVNLVLALAEDVAVKGNKFVRAQVRECRRGEPSGIDPTSLVWMFDCKNVRIEGNTAIELGPFCKTLVKVENSVQDVSGAEDGLKVLSRFKVK